MSRDVEDRLASQEGEIETVKRGLDEVHSGLDAVLARLQQLSNVQEALELQTALLSREAENDLPRVAMPPSGSEAAAVPGMALQRLEHKLVELARTLEAAVEQDDSRTGALIEEIQAMKSAGAVLHDRVIRLERRRGALNETVKSLNLQHVRGDHETDKLGRRLRRLSILTALAGLLAVGALSWLSVSQLDSQETRVVESGEVAPAPSPEERADLTELRQEVARLDDAVASVASSVEELAAAPDPVLSRQVDDLEEKVDELLQAQHQQALKDLVVDVEERSAGPLPGEPLRDAEIARSAVDGQTVPPTAMTGPESDEAPAAAPDPPPAAAESVPVTPKSDAAESAQAKPGFLQRWKAAGRKGHYTLQLVGVGKRQSLEAFLARFPADGDRVIHHGRRDGRDWLELFHGIYPTRQSAMAAVGSLPPELAAQGPWVRRIPTGGQLEPL